MKEKSNLDFTKMKNFSSAKVTIKRIKSKRKIKENEKEDIH